jgi:hypothetical protein
MTQQSFMGNSWTRHAPTGKGGRSSLRSKTRSDAPSIGNLPMSPLHYFMFCSTLKLSDDWTLANQSQEGANVQQALFAAHLATGSALHCRSIKSANINCYLIDVVKFIGRYREVDPRFTSSADTKLGRPNHCQGPPRAASVGSGPQPARTFHHVTPTYPIEKSCVRST